MGQYEPVWYTDISLAAWKARHHLFREIVRKQYI